MMATYTARATRSGDWWAVEVDELDGVFTQARRLDQVETMARDAIALLLDADPDSFDVVVVSELPTKWRTELHELWSMRAAADVLAAMAATKMRRTVRLLHDSQGLPMREIGAVLGVSHQRVHQVLSDPPSTIDDADVHSLFRLCVDPEMVEKAKAELGL